MDLTQHENHRPQAGKGSFPISLLSLTVGAFAIGMTEFVIMGILPNVAESLHVSISAAGQLITLYALGVALGAPILTVLTSRIPQKKLLIFLMLLFIAGNGIAAIAPNYAVLMGARVLTALTHGTFFGVGAVIAANLVRPDKRASAVSVMMAGLTIANILGVPLGTYIGQHLGWRASFVSIALMGVLALVGVALLIPRMPQEEAAGIRQQVAALMSPKLLVYLLIFVLGNAGLFAVFTYITPLLVEITGFTEENVTWILVLFGVGVTVGNIVGGKLADWKLMPSVLGTYTAIVLALTALTFTIHSEIAALVTIFIWGAGSFAVMPGLQVRIMSIAKDAPTLAATSSHSAGNLGNAIGAFVGGVVIPRLSLSSLPWVGAILVALALAVGFGSVLMERRES
ncbi:MFS transporter [Gorillibacterium timonense]|uniref:MFS transporter n=1 Tax=Gorillibacterium timonense TaxID=1689269 RepID=UPI00071D4991|nr:MFS transporter [Gorillibacterium timonense]